VYGGREEGYAEKESGRRVREISVERIGAGEKEGVNPWQARVNNKKAVRICT
jgi:hypothetical protein